MTAAEFDALVRLLPGPPGAAREAARLTLVNGMPMTQAAERAGAHYKGVARVVARLRQLQRNGCPTCGQPVWE